MFDAVHPENIPRGAWAVAGYSDGAYNWTVPQWEYFMNSWRIPITVLGGHTGARVVDCETGDVSPAGAAQWANREIHSGRRPTVYCNRSTYPTVKWCLEALNLQFGRDVSLWLAAPDGVALLSVPGDPVVYAGLVAKQYGQGSGGIYDLSVVEPLWVQAVAVGGPPQTAGIGPATVVTVTNNGQTLTVDIATLKRSNPPAGAVITLTLNGVEFTTDVGTLRNAGVL